MKDTEYAVPLQISGAKFLPAQNQFGTNLRNYEIARNY